MPGIERSSVPGIGGRVDAGGIDAELFHVDGVARCSATYGWMVHRPPRIRHAGVLAHITMHAADGLALYPSARDAQVFLERLGRVAGRHAIEVHCYCLMSTHYHLLIRDLDGAVSPAMGELNGWYARHYNTRRQRRGPVFDRRFHRTIINDNDHLQACIRYIVRNPVEAGLCAAPGDWAWSSHRATIGATRRPPFLRTELLLGSPESPASYLKLVGDMDA